MKKSLSTKWFVWFSIAIAVFCIFQMMGLIWVEAGELIRGEGSPRDELREIAAMLSVSVGVFVIMAGAFWFVSKRMTDPIRLLAESADRITSGNLQERLEPQGAAVEVEILALSLNRAFDQYHEVVKRLERFSGSVAHQLRTPLASIRSIGEVCLQEERSSAEYRESIADMLEVAEELSRVVEKLLMIARLNPVQLRNNFTVVDVADTLYRVLDIYRIIFEEKNISLKLGEFTHLTVKGDEDLIGHAIGNIVDNAAKFTPDGGIVSVALQERDGGAILRVCDTGPGMPAPISLYVSSRNENTMRDDKKPSGRLGLSIVSDVIHLHEGKIAIEPNEGGGTCVEIFIPSKPGSTT